MKFFQPIEAKPYFLIPDNLDFDSLVLYRSRFIGQVDGLIRPPFS